MFAHAPQTVVSTNVSMLPVTVSEIADGTWAPKNGNDAVAVIVELVAVTLYTRGNVGASIIDTVPTPELLTLIVIVSP